MTRTISIAEAMLLVRNDSAQPESHPELWHVEALLNPLAAVHSIASSPLTSLHRDNRAVDFADHCNASATSSLPDGTPDTSKLPQIMVITTFEPRRLCFMVQQLLRHGLRQAIFYPASMLSGSKSQMDGAWRAMEPYVEASQREFIGHRGAQAIFLSNLRLWYRLSGSSPATAYTILEDDAVLAPEFVAVLRHLVEPLRHAFYVKWSCPPINSRCPSFPPGLLPTSRSAQGYELKSIRSMRSAMDFAATWSGAFAYTISQQTVHAFVEGFVRGIKGRRHFDHFMGHLARLHGHQVHAMRCEPYPVYHSRFPSLHAAQDRSPPTHGLQTGSIADVANAVEHRRLAEASSIPCSPRLFVYQLPARYRHKGHPGGRGFGHVVHEAAHVRLMHSVAGTYGTGAAIYERAMTYTCRTDDPAAADLFFIPVFISTYRPTSGYCAEWPCNRTSLHRRINRVRNASGVPFLTARGGLDHFFVSPKSGRNFDLPVMRKR